MQRLPLACEDSDRPRGELGRHARADDEHRGARRCLTAADRLPSTAPVETHVWRLPHVQVNGLEQEPDGDIHLVVSDAQGRTMIAEFPNAACLSGAQSAPRAAMTGARNELVAAYGPPGPGFNRASGTVSLAGVGFFDVLHGQAGAARNGVELHPALAFRVETGAGR